MTRTSLAGEPAFDVPDLEIAEPQVRRPAAVSSEQASEYRYESRISSPGLSGTGDGMKSKLKRSWASVSDTFAMVTYDRSDRPLVLSPPEVTEKLLKNRFNG